MVQIHLPLFKKMNRVFIIHGWGGHPEEAWFLWLKKELESKEFEVHIPKMPNTNYPTIKEWVSYLRNSVGKVNRKTYFVGHSVGCQTILRYLETLSENLEIGGAVFIAPWLTLANIEKDEEKIAKPWLEIKINFDKIKKHTNNIIAIFSDDDDVVPLENKKFFEKKLNAKTFVEHNKGHFSGSDNITKIPIILNELLRISK